MNSLLDRPWKLLLACSVPTVLVTAAVAYNLGATFSADSLADVPRGMASAAKRVVAKPMLPGAQAATAGGIVAAVSYAGDTSSLPASAMVFIFARRAGVAMPVAVEKYQPSQLPVEVVFRAFDETSEALLITARLSLAGGVRLEPGDVEANSQPMVPGAQETRVELLIPSL